MAARLFLAWPAVDLSLQASPGRSIGRLLRVHCLGRAGHQEENNAERKQFS